MAVLPSDLQAAFVSLSSSGAANGSTDGVLIPAPGVGVRVRLWRFQAMTSDTAQLPTKWMAAVLNQALTTVFGGVALPGFGFGEVSWPGGLRLPTNERVNYRIQSTVGALALWLAIDYTIEATA